MYIMMSKTFGRSGEPSLDPGTPGKDYLFYESRMHIIPISELRDTSKVSELADSAMVTVTKNGHSHLRVFSEDAFEKLMDRLEFLENCYALQIAEKGAVMDSDKFIEEARRRYGLQG